MKNATIFVDPRKISNALSLTALALIAASSLSVGLYAIVGAESAIVRKAMKFFYVELELNAPSFFSGMLLLFAACLTAMAYCVMRRESPGGNAPWLVLAFGFTLMAFDEIVAVHERLIEPFREILGGENLGVFYFAWVVPAIPVVAALAIYFARFLIRLPASTRSWFVASATLFLSGAIGVELLGGKHTEIHGKANGTYFVMTTVEETLEMFGVIGFVRGILRYLSEQVQMVSFGFSKTVPAPNAVIVLQADEERESELALPGVV